MILKLLLFLSLSLSFLVFLFLGLIYISASLILVNNISKKYYNVLLILLYPGHLLRLSLCTCSIGAIYYNTKRYQECYRMLNPLINKNTVARAYIMVIIARCHMYGNGTRCNLFFAVHYLLNLKEIFMNTRNLSNSKFWKKFQNATLNQIIQNLIRCYYARKDYNYLIHNLRLGLTLKHVNRDFYHIHYAKLYYDKKIGDPVKAYDYLEMSCKSDLDSQKMLAKLYSENKAKTKKMKVFSYCVDKYKLDNPKLLDKYSKYELVRNKISQIILDKILNRDVSRIIYEYL